MDLTDEQQRLLTAEERAALQEDYDPDADNAAAVAAIGNTDVANDGGASDDAGGDQSTQASTQSSAPAPTQDQPGNDANDGGAAQDEPAAPQLPTVFAATLPVDYDTQVAANKEARRELQRKYNAGDIDDAEHDAEVERLDDERLALASVKNRAEIAAEMQQQAQRNAWQETITEFFSDAKSKAGMGLIDYQKDTAKQTDLDHFVRALAAVPGNENKPRRWYFEEAHKRVVALHGIPVTTAATPASKRRAPPVDSISPSLADVPGGGATDALDDEFSAIDKLTGPDAERAYNALSPEKQVQYLRRAV